MTSLPTFVVIGTRKAATTTLWMHFRAHPEAFVSDVKEVRYFDEDEHWQAGRGWYEQHFAAAATAGGVKAIGDVSPSYSTSTEALDRLRATLPDARLIMVLRDPVERIVSHLSHLHRERRLGDVRAAVEGDLAAEPSERTVLQASRYARQLAAVTARFDPAQLLVVLYEEFRSDPASVLRSVFEHVGIDPTFTPDTEIRENERHDLRSWRLHRWCFTGRLPRRVPRLVAPIIRWNVRVADFALPVDLRHRLEDALAPDVLAVEHHLGRSLADLWPTAAAAAAATPEPVLAYR